MTLDFTVRADGQHHRRPMEVLALDPWQVNDRLRQNLLRDQMSSQREPCGKSPSYRIDALIGIVAPRAAPIYFALAGPRRR